MCSISPSQDMYALQSRTYAGDAFGQLIRHQSLEQAIQYGPICASRGLRPSWLGPLEQTYTCTSLTYIVTRLRFGSTSRIAWYVALHVEHLSTLIADKVKYSCCFSRHRLAAAAE
jgi:hypothetical protein